MSGVHCVSAGTEFTVLTGMTAGRASKAQGYSDPASEAPGPIETEHEADRIRTVIWYAVNACREPQILSRVDDFCTEFLGSDNSIRLQGISASVS